MAKQQTKKVPEKAKTVEELQFEEHIKNLGFACRIAGVQTDKGVLELLVKLSDLVKDKGNQVTIHEITELQQKYVPEASKPQPPEPGRSQRSERPQR